MDELKKETETLRKEISDSKRRIEVLEEENEKLLKQSSEMVASQKEKEQEYQRKMALEREQLSKKSAELQKKCDGFFKQVVSLNGKQQESEAELDRLKRALEHQGAELDEKKSMIHLMTESVSDCVCIGVRNTELNLRLS